MRTISVQIRRYVSDDFPGWVECAMQDAAGQTHLFIEKVPVVTSENLTVESSYPQPGVVACEIEAEWKNETGHSVVRICTERPDGIESTTGLTNFVVFAHQLVQDE
jgi:hypothetical protein